VAKIVYDPTKDGSRKPKKKPSKPEKPISDKRKALEEEVLNLMTKFAENGITEVGSRLVADKLGLEPDRGRQQVRALMKRLEKAGKVVISQKQQGKRKQYIYTLKE
jgi:predicted transcriptional regulator